MKKDMGYKMLVCVVLVLQLVPIYCQGLNSFGEIYCEGLRRVKEIKITPELVQQLYQQVLSGTKDEVKALANKYLPALARLNFAEDIDVSSEQESRFRSLVFGLIREMTNKLGLQYWGRDNPSFLWNLWVDFAKNKVQTPLITRINEQFVLITNAESYKRKVSDSSYRDTTFFIFYGKDISGKEVVFTDDALKHLHNKIRMLFDWDGYIWPADLLNWPE
jgi:hypothetical protein